MKRNSTLAPVVVVIATLTLLGGCVGPVDTSGAVAVSPDTIAASEVAALAEGSIRENSGADVAIDCGEGDVAFEVGTVLECTGREAGTDVDVPVTLEIVLVDGDYYEIDVSSTGPEPVEPEQPAGPEATVPSADFEAVVVTALEQLTGERGVVDCGPDDVLIAEGQELICSVVLSSGFAETLVTITLFDGSNYEITAELLE